MPSARVDTFAELLWGETKSISRVADQPTFGEKLIIRLAWSRHLFRTSKFRHWFRTRRSGRRHFSIRTLTVVEWP